jgi:leucyl-tRNA synthetase
MNRLYTECPKCGSDKAFRETETCDTFFDSSWYFLRYASEPLDNMPFDPSLIQPVFCYVGGVEHAALHLFYARFITHFLHKKGLCHFREPFKTLLMQSVIKGRTYKVDGKYVNEKEAKNHKNVVIEYEKMSKSKGNGVNPDDLIDKYGCDATRWTIVSFATSNSEKLWKDEETEFHATLAFFHRVLLTVEEFREAKQQQKTGQKLMKIKKLNQNDLENASKELISFRNQSLQRLIYNLEFTNQSSSAIKSLHSLIKALRKFCETDVLLTIEYEKCLATLLIMLSPFAPHFAAECWKGFASHAIGSQEYDINKSILEQKWPTNCEPSIGAQIQKT